jgi:glycosyltransferase involved in cell wall biosynthesis
MISKPSPPLFSVIIPTFNRVEKVSKAIQSVLNQSYTNYEILVMDDGSCDNTRSVVEKYNDNRIKYEWAPNSGGPANPRNRGLKIASGDWVAFLDADDVWYKSRLLKTVEDIRRLPNVVVFCHDEILYDVTKNRKTLLKHGPYQNNFYQTLLINGNRLSTSATTIRKDFLLDHGLKFNEDPKYSIIEDYDLWLELARHNAQFYFNNTALGEYIVEQDNISSNFKKSRTNLIYVLRHHVFYLQKFENNKKMLWSLIVSRINIGDAFLLIFSGSYLMGTCLLLRETFVRPLKTIKRITNKFFNFF